MRILYLARHAKSSWADSRLDDFDRPLNDRGFRDAPLMARFLAGAGELPDAIVTSPARRALTTATLIAETLGLPPGAVSTEQSLYAASMDTILDVIRAFDDAWRRPMVVGHNPGMSNLASGLSGGRIDHLPTCAIASFELPAESWTGARAGGAKMRFFETPRNLKG